MEKAEYQKMHSEEQTYWWHIARRYLFDLWLKRLRLPKSAQILDVGCGTGINLKMLSKYGEVRGLDISDEALEFCRQQGFTNLAKGDAVTLNEESGNVYDLVTALEVLEHLPDDGQALKHWHRVAKPGGYLLITVPAYQWLFSAHDKALHHYRRYSMTGLIKKIKQAGWQIKKASYFMMLTFPALMPVRLLQKNALPRTSYVPTKTWLNNLLINLLKIEANLTRLLAIPFGSSIVVLAKKIK
jgi:2-polyprenyl-3-methyl-5-hydroxy-6-metoxy-1,4-benzoquinol methylase